MIWNTQNKDRSSPQKRRHAQSESVRGQRSSYLACCMQCRLKVTLPAVLLQKPKRLSRSPCRRRQTGGIGKNQRSASLLTFPSTESRCRAASRWLTVPWTFQVFWHSWDLPARGNLRWRSASEQKLCPSEEASTCGTSPCVYLRENTRLWHIRP